MSHQSIIDQMAALQDLRVDYKIAPEDSLSIIGSNSINTAGDLYTVNISAINSITNKRNKRFLDMAVSLILVGLLPVMVFVAHSPIGLLKNVILVLLGRRSWVGYVKLTGDDTERLPHIRKGILTPLDAFTNRELPDDLLHSLSFLYARDYSINTDINIIFKGIRRLGCTNREPSNNSR
jgi:hypothetical protein